MIELPEAITITRQMREALTGKRIAAAVRGNAPHKFAFYTRSPEDYEALLAGKILGSARDHGNHIVLPAGDDLILVLGGGGERILYHESERTLPKKHQLLLRFDDDTYLSVTVQGWGAAQLFTDQEFSVHPHVQPKAPSPLSEAFTYPYFAGLYDALEPGDPRSVKFFFVSEPGVWGVGNGYLQDILFHARVHPRRRALETTADERRALYDATVTTLRQAADLGGRDTERDLYNRPGQYVRLMDSKTAGQPCPSCGTPIEKIAFLGGACYFCPTCQV